MKTGDEAPTVLPLGCNCQLGAALTRFGAHEPSLFRWADIDVRSLLAFLEGERPAPFSGRIAFRFVGTAFGTLDHAAMRARLAEAPEGARVNTIVCAREGGAYTHGVQLSRNEADNWSYDEISAANATKIEHLERRWRADLSRAAPVAIRLEWTPVTDASTYARLAAALRRVNPAVELNVVGPPGSLEGRGDGLGFVALGAPLPPLSDVMNVAATESEWFALFTQWGVRPSGAARAYIFDV